ncbi:TPA: hypothetical protein ACVB8O_002177 [Acinetobacter baumannii]
MAQPRAGFFALPGLTMNLYDQYSLRVNDNPYKTLCLSLGGVHKTIQILDMLTPKTEFLNGLEHVINHGVFVPENVYFQTMDRISLVRGDKKPGI